MSILIIIILFFFFFNDTATTEIYTLSLHDALPISAIYFSHSGGWEAQDHGQVLGRPSSRLQTPDFLLYPHTVQRASERSEEHTSELQSRQYLVCRLLLEKKK